MHLTGRCRRASSVSIPRSPTTISSGLHHPPHSCYHPIATMTSANTDTLRLTSHNLLRLGRGSSLTPSWGPDNPTQWLSSEASSTRLPMDYRIKRTQQQVWSYMNQLSQIKPEGARIVLEAEVQSGRKHVWLKPNTASSLNDNVHALAFWIHQRFYFEQQLAQLMQHQSSTAPVSPTLPEMRGSHCASVNWTDRRAILQQRVETWLSTVPGESGAHQVLPLPDTVGSRKTSCWI